MNQRAREGQEKGKETAKKQKKKKGGGGGLFYPFLPPMNFDVYLNISRGEERRKREDGGRRREGL